MYHLSFEKYALQRERGIGSGKKKEVRSQLIDGTKRAVISSECSFFVF